MAFLETLEPSLRIYGGLYHNSKPTRSDRLTHTMHGFRTVFCLLGHFKTPLAWKTSALPSRLCLTQTPLSNSASCLIASTVRYCTVHYTSATIRTVAVVLSVIRLVGHAALELLFGRAKALQHPHSAIPATLWLAKSVGRCL